MQPGLSGPSVPGLCGDRVPACIGASFVQPRRLRCASVSVASASVSVREGVPARACPTPCTNRCPGCGGRMAGFLPTYANIHLARGFSIGDGDLPHGEVRVYSSAHLEPLVANLGNDRRHASAWFEWRSRGWLSLGSGFEYRTGSGSSTLTPDPSSALLKTSPQADIVRRTIITDDRECAHQGGRPESRGQLRQGSEASRVHRGGCGCGVESHEVRRGHMGGKD